MKTFLIFTILFIVAIFAGLVIVQDPGYAYFSYADWSLEMPLWLAALLFLFVIFSTYLLVRAVNNISRATLYLKNKFQKRARLRLLKKTRLGIIAYLEGDYTKSEKLLAAGIPKNTSPFINHIYAAQAAFAQGDSIRGEEYLNLAKAEEPAATDVIDMIQAQSDIKHHRFTEALASLKRISLHNKHVLLTLKTVYIQLGDWPALFDLLPQLGKLMPSDEFTLFSLTVYTHFLTDASDMNIDALNLAWHKLPRATRKDPALIAIYAKTLIQFDDHQLAEPLLKHSLKKQWDTKLIKLYGTLKSDKPEKLLHTAEKHLKEHADSPELLLALGSLCTECALWGKAKDYLQETHRLAPSKDSALALARLHEKLGDTGKSLAFYKQSI